MNNQLPKCEISSSVLLDGMSKCSTLPEKHTQFPEKPRKTRRFSCKTILPFVCGAVIHLRDNKGSSVSQITNYLKSETIVDDSHVPLIEKALKKAVKCDVLKEQVDGKFKLALNDCMTIDKLIKQHVNSFSCGCKRKRRKKRCPVKKKRRCGKKRRKKPKCKPRKKRKLCRRPCTKMWVPRKCRKKPKKCEGEDLDEEDVDTYDNNVPCSNETSTNCESSDWTDDECQRFDN